MKATIDFDHIGPALLGQGTPSPSESLSATPSDATDEDSEDLGSGGVKQVLFGLAPWETPDKACVVSLKTPAEVAAVLTVTVALGYLTNQKAEVKALLEPLEQSSYRDALTSYESTLCFQKFMRKASGEFDCHKPGPKDARLGFVPKATLDASKIAGFFSSPDAAVALAKDLDWSSVVFLTSVSTVVTSMGSHSAKLAGGDGLGNFMKSSATHLPDPYEGSVTEDDFQTSDKYTFGGNASLQKLSYLAQTWVSYRGIEDHLLGHLRKNAELLASVKDILTAKGARDIDAFFAAALTPPDTKLLGESQVLCAVGEDLRCLSVLTPYSVFKEIADAKRAVESAYRNDQDAASSEIEKHILQTTQAIADFPALPAKASKADKARRNASLTVLKETVKRLKESQSVLKKKFLSVPYFELKVGGSSPQNVAAGLSKSIHNANVRTSIFTQPVGLKVKPKVFFGNSLVQPPELDKKSLPRCFQPGSTLQAHKVVRNEIVTEATYAAIADLLTVRDLWNTGSPEANSALGAASAEAVKESAEPWALFVRGSDALNISQAMETLKPLCKRISECVVEGLQAAYEGFPANLHVSEIQQVVEAVVHFERN
jgi:hypothetical protein